MAPVAGGKYSKAHTTDEEVDAHHVLNPGSIVSGVWNCAKEEAVERFTPVVVQAAEIALDTANLQLCESLADAEEQEVEVENGFVDALGLYRRETQCRDRD